LKWTCPLKLPTERKTKKIEVPENIVDISRIKREEDRQPGFAIAEIKSGSMNAALAQALNTKDETLLKKVLSIESAHTIASTVSSLPKDKIVPLLEAITNRLRSHPLGGLNLLKWLKITFEEHLFYLLKEPSILEKLSPLYAIVDSRLAMFRKIASVSGRLELLIKMAEKAKDKTQIYEPQAQFTYKEGGEVSESGSENDDVEIVDENENDEQQDDDDDDDSFENEEEEDDE